MNVSNFVAALFVFEPGTNFDSKLPGPDFRAVLNRSNEPQGVMQIKNLDNYG